jgi:hypothetical protein
VFGNLGKAGNSTESNAVDPFPGFDDCGEQSITALGLQRGLAEGV